MALNGMKFTKPIQSWLIVLFLFLLPPVYLKNLIPFTQWKHGVMIGDPQLNLWAMTWQLRNLLIHPFDLWNANAFYPSQNSITGSDHLFSQVLCGLPVYLITQNPFLTYHFLIFLAYGTGAWGIFALVKYLADSQSSAFLAAIFFITAFPRSVHAPTHIQLTSMQWMPWSCLFLLKFAFQGGTRNIVLFGIMTWLQILSSWYLAVYEVIVLALMATLLLPQRIPWRRWIGIGICSFLVITAVLPFAIPYMGRHDSTDVGMYSAELKDYFRPSRDTIWGKCLGINELWSERSVCPGFLVWVVIIAGAIGSFAPGFSKRPPVSNPTMPENSFPLNRASSEPPGWVNPVSKIRFLGRLGILIGVVSFILSLGPFFHGNPSFRLPYYFLAKHIPVFSQQRVPARFSLLLVFAIALGIGWSFLHISKLLQTLTRRLVAVTILVMMIMIEQYPFVSFIPSDGSLPSVYQWLKHQPESTVVAEIPEFYGSSLWGFSADYMMYAAIHGRQIINGYTRYPPVGYQDRASVLNQFPSVESLMELQKLGVDYIILHPQKFFHQFMQELFVSQQTSEEPIHVLNQIIALSNDHFVQCYSGSGDRIERDSIQSPHLILVQRFDRDLVFRIRIVQQ